MPGQRLNSTETIPGLDWDAFRNMLNDSMAGLADELGLLTAANTESFFADAWRAVFGKVR